MTDINKVLEIAKKEGLHRGMLYYSSFINSAPKKRNRINGYNKYTPQGQMTRINPNYKKELTAWKNMHLFPFFLENGYNRQELNESWKVSVFKK